MPLLTKMSERANSLFSSGQISQLSWPGGRRLSTVATKLGIAESKAETDYLDSWPEALQRCILATLEAAAKAKPPSPVSISWAPDYDFSVTVWDARSTEVSGGGITILLKSRYPDDPR